MVEQQNGAASPQCQQQTTQSVANKPPRKVNGTGMRRSSNTQPRKRNDAGRRSRMERVNNEMV